MDQSSQKPNPEVPVAGSAPVETLDPPNEVNIGATADIDGAHSEFAPSNSAYSVNSSSADATTVPKKHSWPKRLLDEAKEVGLVMGYLATAFCIIQTFRCATILAKCSENDFAASYASACITAVVLGKFVFVIEKMRISKRFENRPLIVPVLYRTALFTIFANILMRMESHFAHHNSASVNPDIAAGDPLGFALCAFAHQLAIIVTFFIFFTFREIARVLGKGSLKKMFFVSIN